MKKYLNYLLSLNNLRKTYNIGLLHHAAKNDLDFQIIDKFQQETVLILSPHPDDDVFGLGGTINKMIQANSNIYVLYVFNGIRGNLQRVKDKSLVDQRKIEAKKAADILGVKNLTFWGYDDGQAILSKHTISALKSLIEEIKPDIIYLPSFWDNHPDHFEVCKLLGETLQKLSHLEPKIFLYEIWSPIFINRLVEISDDVKQKQQAMAVHQSQLKSRPYDEAILALNKYRAMIMVNNGFAEGFFACSPKVFLEIFKKLI